MGNNNPGASRPLNDVAIYTDYEGYSAAFTTGPDFGCIHWEAKITDLLIERQKTHGSFETHAEIEPGLPSHIVWRLIVAGLAIFWALFAMALLTFCTGE